MRKSDENKLNKQPIFKTVINMDFACICKDCAKKYFGYFDGFDFTKGVFYTNDVYITKDKTYRDFYIDENVCSDEICEFGNCTNDAELTLNYNAE